MQVTLELSPTPDSVGRARRWTVAFAHESGYAPISDTLALLVSELVSNVVLHARTQCSLSVQRTEHGVRVEVHDGSDHLPGGYLNADPMAQTGRGMVLVEGLSQAHGAHALAGGGKSVWFELDLPAEGF